MPIGLRVGGDRFLQVVEALARLHYAVHEGKPFFDPLIRYITASPVMAMVWEGPRAIAIVRQTMGATSPSEAAPGSVRHDFGLEIGRNLTHASDSGDTARPEIGLWFRADELGQWEGSGDR